MVRVTAATALGDTADPAALGPLATALADPKHLVSAAAVEAIARLAKTTSVAAVSGDPIRQRLVAALADKKTNVARIAALTLISLGNGDAVGDHVARNPRRRRLFARALSGDLPPFPPSWPGDETV